MDPSRQTFHPRPRCRRWRTLTAGAVAGLALAAGSVVVSGPAAAEAPSAGTVGAGSAPSVPGVHAVAVERTPAVDAGVHPLPVARHPARAVLTYLSASTPVGASAFTAAPAPVLSGAVRVGSLVRAVPGSWSPAATSSYQWRRDGAALPGATASAYRPGRADQGHRLSVTVTGRRNGYTTLSRTSAAATVNAGLFTAAPVPTISGAALGGATLAVRPGTWRPAAVLVYRWYRNGVPIVGATHPSYRLTSADYGRRITVRTSAIRFGYRTTRRTSAPTAVVTRPFAATVAPRITGTARVGATLTALVRAWTPRAAFTYQWLRGGAVIPGATGARYRLTGSDYHRAIAVRVYGRRTGYYTTRRTGALTVLIAAPPPVLTRDGVYRVGTDITPGTYMSRGGDFCYWERRSTAGDSFDGLIANDLGYGQRIVRIAASDRFFDTERCGTWTRLVGFPRSSMGDGVFAVTTQVRPGLYRTTGSPSYCYWARLAGFSGSMDDLIDNGSGSGRRYVRIHPGDAGVESSGCGMWQRVSG